MTVAATASLTIAAMSSPASAASTSGFFARVTGWRGVNSVQQS